MHTGAFSVTGGWHIFLSCSSFSTTCVWGGSRLRAATGSTPTLCCFSRFCRSRLCTSNKLGPDDEEDEVEDALRDYHPLCLNCSSHASRRCFLVGPRCFRKRRPLTFSPLLFDLFIYLLEVEVTTSLSGCASGTNSSSSRPIWFI